MFKDRGLRWILGGVGLGVCGAAAIFMFTPKAKVAVFDGKDCKVHVRLRDVRCGKKQFRLGQITLRGGMSAELLRPGDNLNCSPRENGGAECELVTETPT